MLTAFKCTGYILLFWTLSRGILSAPKNLVLTLKYSERIWPLYPRVFLNLSFAKPAFCPAVVSYENHGNHENDENDVVEFEQENKGLRSGFTEITESTEMTKTTGIQGTNNGFPKRRV